MDHYFSLGFRGLKIGAGSLSPGRLVHAEEPAEAANFEAEKFCLSCVHTRDPTRGCMDAHMGNNHVTTWSVGNRQSCRMRVGAF